MSAFASLLQRDLLLAYRQGVDALIVVFFFLVAGVLFPFAVGPMPELLSRMAAGVVMVMAALAALLSLDRMFQADLEDGGLDQIAMAPIALELVILAKALVHWITASLPLLVAAPLLSIMLHLSPAEIPSLLGALLLTTPALSLLGTLGAALTLGARRASLLLTLLILPLYVPILIFGIAMANPVVLNIGQVFIPLTILTAMDLGLLAIVPWASAAAIRLALR